MRAGLLITLILGSSISSSCISRSGPPKVEVPVVHTNLYQEILPNGTKLVVETAEDTPISGVVVAVRAGGAMDPAGKEGLAHLVEHLVLRAQHRNGAPVNHRLNRLVAAWNGATLHDGTSYHAFARKEDFAALADVMTDVVAAPLAGVTSEVFEHERQVVEAERGTRTEHAGGEINAWIEEMVFSQRHPHARPVIGTASSLPKLQLEDARRFVADYYRPERMTVYAIASPDVQALSLLRQALNTKLDTRTATRVPEFAAEHLESLLNPPGEIHKRAAALSTPELWLVWALPAASPEERANARLVADVAQTGVVPTFKSHADVANAGCSARRQHRGTILLSCWFLLNDAHDVQGVHESAIHELRKAFEFGGLSQQRFWWLRQRFALSQALHLERLQDRGMSRALAAHASDSPFGLESALEAVDNVDMNRLRNDAHQWLTPQRAYTLVIEPSFEQSTTLHGGTEKPTTNVTLKPYEEVATRQTLNSLPNRKGAQLQRFRLNNGLEVMHLPVAGPFMTSLLGFRGGYEWALNPAAARAMRHGEVWRVHPDPTDWGVGLTRHRVGEQQWEMARTLSDDIDKSFEVLKSARTLTIEWPSPPFQRSSLALRQLDEGPHVRMQRAFNQALFGGHPYSNFASVDETEAMTIQQIRRFVNGIRRPDNALLVVAGELDSERVRKAAERWFGDWQVPRDAPHPRLPAVQLGVSDGSPKQIVTANPGARQVDVEFSCVVPGIHPTDAVANSILRRWFADVLEARLREKSGIAYGVRATGWEKIAQVSTIGFGTRVANRHLEQALSEIHSVFNESPSIGDLNRVRWQLIKSEAFRATAGVDWAFWVYALWTLGLSPTDLDKYPQRLLETSLDRIVALKRSCLEHAVIGLSGDESVIQAALANVSTAPATQ